MLFSMYTFVYKYFRGYFSENLQKWYISREACIAKYMLPKQQIACIWYCQLQMTEGRKFMWWNKEHIVIGNVHTAYTSCTAKGVRKLATISNSGWWRNFLFHVYTTWRQALCLACSVYKSRMVVPPTGRPPLQTTVSARRPFRCTKQSSTTMLVFSLMIAITVSQATDVPCRQSKWDDYLIQGLTDLSSYLVMLHILACSRRTIFRYQTSFAPMEHI